MILVKLFDGYDLERLYQSTESRCVESLAYLLQPLQHNLRLYDRLYANATRLVSA